MLGSDHLTIYQGDSHEDLPKSEVTRIEIRQAGRFFRHVIESAQLVELATESILLPPFLAYTAASTPFVLAADGIAFLIPPKVYDIVH